MTDNLKMHDEEETEKLGAGRRLSNNKSKVIEIP